MASPRDITGNQLREWAARCAAQAEETRSLPDRERLLAMKNALLDLANNEDWLAGKLALASSIGEAAGHGTQ